MGNDGKQPGLSTTGVLWLVLLGAGALFLHDVPWQGSRPDGPEPKRSAKAAHQEVDARLWQDPMGAVAQAREELRKRDGADPKQSGAPAREDDPSGLFCAKDAPHRNDKGVLVMGAMVSGAPYPERIEFRRRARYAILAGLNESGFVPEDEEHLGYFVPQRPREGANQTGKPPPEFIAYEWLLPAEANLPGRAARAADRAARQESVLLLWLDEDSFGDDPNAKVQALARSLLECPASDAAEGVPRKEVRIDAQVVVLGPSATWSLQSMITAAKASGKGERLGAGKTEPADAPKTESIEEIKDPAIPVTFYAYGATADDAGLLADAGFKAKGGPRSVHRMLKDRKVMLFRTINSDDALANELTRELALRDVKPNEKCTTGGSAKCQHVVLIAERDSFYGRSLPWTMASRLVDPAGTATIDIDDYPSWVHPYSYLRGLDGQLPSGATSESGASSKDDGDAKASAHSGGADAKRIERPDGQGQYDYLRRLSDQLVALDGDLRSRGQGSIRAIGVLGSDVYDKLLILQALRAQFPNAIVFTTDIDAIYQHPKQLQWTRNAIVASSFGLQLAPSLQRDILPFRDNYQTSLFLSSMIAVSHARFRAAAADKRDSLACPSVYAANERDCWGITQHRIMRWLGAPRVFEIGRTAAFDFSRVPAPADELDAFAASGFKPVAFRLPTPPCSPRDLAACGGVHPSPSPLYPEPATRWLQGAFLIVVGGLALGGLASGTWGRLATRIAAAGPSEAATRRRRFIAMPLLFVAAALVCLAFIGIAPLWHAFAGFLTQGSRGEPIALMEGVSIWPTVLIRLVATGLSLWFICRSWRALSANCDQISAKFKWDQPRAILEAQGEAQAAAWRPWQRVLRIFSYRLGEDRPGPVQQDTGLTPSAERFWIKYLYQGRWWARISRVLLATVAYMALAAFVIHAMGGSESPYRGSLAGHLEPALRHVAVFATLFLVFFVVDATAFCYQLVSELRKKLPAHEDGGPEVAPGESGETRWPERTLDKYAAKLGLDKAYLDDWITMHFVALRTQAVARLVYYPFIVIALMVLSRSSLFDNWATPIGLVIVVTSSVAIVMACAILLRMAAERLRRRAIWRLTNSKVKLKSQGGEGSRVADQIELMITQIRAFDTGAFAPYSQQPIVRALLLPLTSYGGAALLDYLSIANF